MILVQIQLCEGFWTCITPDGIINAVSTILTIVGAFLVAFLTSRKQRLMLKKEQSESSKKIFLRHKMYFNTIEISGRMLLKGKNTNAFDRKLILSSLYNNLNKVIESGILDHAPSEIDTDINTLINSGNMIYNSLEIVNKILKEEATERYEEYLLNKEANHYDEINDLISVAENHYDELKRSLEHITTYYK